MLNPTMTTSELTDLANNHILNKNLPCETDSVVIELNHLQTFIDQAKARLGSDFNAVKIHFIRYELDVDQSHIKKIAGKDLSQVSLALVPANIIRSEEHTSELQ